MPGSDQGPVLVLGATGRIGTLLARHWALNPPGREILFQTRGPVRGPGWLSWFPGETPLPRIGNRDGGGTMVILIRAEAGRDAEVLRHCLAAAREARMDRVLYASSQAVYGLPGTAPFRERDDTRPATEYGLAKKAAEAECHAARAAGQDVTALRIGNVAGADMLLMNAERARDDLPLKLDRFPDGAGPRRSYIGIDTLARILIALADAPVLPPVLNLAAPTPVTMEALVRAVGVPWAFAPAPATAVQDVTLDVGALEALVPFSAGDSEPAAMVASWQALKAGT